MTEVPNQHRDLLKRAFVRIEELERRLAGTGPVEPLAVVGLGCRFPGGADDPDAFWERLLAGFDATVEVPADRWDVDAFYDPEPGVPGRMYTRRGAFLTEGVDRFDAGFFGIAPREADTMDPHQRLLLEVVWEALERAGIAPAGLSGTDTGVYVGVGAQDWGHIRNHGQDASYIDTYYGTGTSHSVAAGRIAYTLGLRGAALTIDTACSSSLVAFHEACQSLRAGEARMAIVAGVGLMMDPRGHVVACAGQMLAPDGRCKTFDAAADGYARGEGCGVVLVKRLADAQADGDPILAVVRGTALNQDGRSAGLTAPSGRAQEEVIRTALERSGLPAAAVGYIEAHGTGTDLGDPIEIDALGAVFGGRDGERMPLHVGSVKTNIGHLEAGAGLAGLIKTVLALAHGTIPPHGNFETPNPHIDWDRLPIRIPTDPVPWPEIDGRRVAGVSSFGFSGTNAHVVLEAWQEGGERGGAMEAPATASGVPLVLALSGRTPGALEALAAAVADRVERDPDLSVARVTSTLALGRNHWEERAAAVVQDREGLLAALRAVATEEPGGAGVLRDAVALRRPPQVAFLFTGQGSQRPGMGRELLATEPVFREAFDACDAILTPLLGRPLRPLLEADPEEEAAAAELRQTHITQPALFALEWSLAELWRSWGVEPAIVLGHSLGEFVAACVAGVLEPEDALRLVAERGRLIGSLPEGGAMAAVFAEEARVARHLAAFPGQLAIAAANTPRNTVVSGDEAAVASLLADLREEGVEGRPLTVSHAFHSRRIDPILEDLRAAAAEAAVAPPRIDVIANRTGRKADAGTFGAAYWVEHARESVRFADSMRLLRDEGIEVLLELGPAPVLLGLAAECPGAPADERRIPSLRPGRNAAVAMREALAQLYVAGVPVRWERVAPGRQEPVPLPTYPFQRERHWPALPKVRSGTAPGAHPLLGRRVDSPWLTGTVFEVDLYDDHPSWAAEHRVFGQAMLPGAAYLEAARAAVSAADAEPAGAVPAVPALREVRILEPMVLTTPRRMQTRIDGDRLEIASRPLAGGDWCTHLTARLEAATTSPTGHPPGTAAAAPLTHAEDGPDSGEEIDAEEYRQRIETAGVKYLGAFRCLSRIRRKGNQAVGEIAAQRIPAAERRAFGVHPAVLDAAFQVCGACIPESNDSVYLPVAVESYTQAAAEGVLGDGTLVATAVLREGGAGTPMLIYDVEVRDPESRAAVHVEGLRFQRVSTPDAAVERRVRDWLYEVAWWDLEVPTADGAGQRWCVLADKADAVVAGVIAEALRRCGCTVEIRGPAGGVGDGTPWDGAVWVPPPTALPEADDGVPAALRPVLEPLLELAREVSRGAVTGRLCVVTRGGCAVRDEDEVRPEAAAVWGLAASIAAELGSVGCRRIDLPEDTVPPGVADALLLAGSEDRLAWRGGAWRAARLKRHAPTDGTGDRPGPGYRLEIPQQGQLDALTLAADEPAEPGPGEVRIRVRATGLNFRDVLNALGRYPGPPSPLGSECVGEVEAVGADVSGLQPGDMVMTITARGFCSHVLAPAVLTARVPDGISVAEAATIPIAFLTADWALHELAGLAAGERVLIHAAAGGVGMAAVKLALAAGAEIHATAGSPRKRAMLLRMGVQHVYDSRSLAFRDGVLAATDGAGVDVVLNSLTDEFIPATLETLAPSGRFVEIGRTGVWTPERVREVRPDSAYHVLFLGEMCQREPERVRERFDALCGRFAAGELHPLPVRGFLIDEVAEAFRFMAQAWHVGKVVVFDAAADADALDGDAAWITGGLGGIGLAVAEDFLARGCRRIALSGRSAPGPEVAQHLEAFREAGAEVLVLPCDVADAGAVRDALETIDARGWPLRHVVHAAGVLADATLAQQDWARFETVLAPKASGAWNLHRVTMALPLRSFVLCSAGAGLLGSPGQANYAAANTFLDGLAQQRRREGLPGQSIAWGPWSEVGMAARAGLDWTGRGLGAIDPRAGRAVLRRMMRGDAAHVAVLPIDWRSFPVTGAGGVVLPFYEALATASADALADGAPEDWRPLLTAASPPDRPRLTEQLLAGEVNRVLGLDPARPLSGRLGLTDLGIDSLMAVELTERLGRHTGLTLPTTLVFEHPTLGALAAHLIEALGLGTLADTDGASPDAGRSREPEAVGRTDEEIAALSADEASAALLAELDRIGY